MFDAAIRRHQPRGLQPLRLLWALMLWVVCAVTGHAETTATVAWDPNQEPDLAGYKVYWGTEPGNYTQVQEVGTVTHAVITGLTEGVTHYFTVTAYNTLGIESAPAQEIAFTPKSGPRLSWEMPSGTAPASHGATEAAAATPRLVLQGQPGQQIEIQATADFVVWESLGTVTLTGQATTFADPAAGLVPSRFYRARVVL
jgi:hypothetical protein